MTSRVSGSMEAQRPVTDINPLSARCSFHRLSEAALNGTATDVEDVHAALVRLRSRRRSDLS